MSIFFFQAEDGIRDIGVTGVQTCALPIYFHFNRRHARSARADQIRSPTENRDLRSEERRVGKSVDLGGRRIIKTKKKKISKKFMRRDNCNAAMFAGAIRDEVSGRGQA